MKRKNNQCIYCNSQIPPHRQKISCGVPTPTEETSHKLRHYHGGEEIFNDLWIFFGACQDLLALQLRLKYQENLFDWIEVEGVGR